MALSLSPSQISLSQKPQFSNSSSSVAFLSFSPLRNFLPAVLSSPPPSTSISSSFSSPSPSPSSPSFSPKPQPLRALSSPADVAPYAADVAPFSSLPNLSKPGNSANSQNPQNPQNPFKPQPKVVQIHTVSGFQKSLKLAKDRLVVVEFFDSEKKFEEEEKMKVKGEKVVDFYSSMVDLCRLNTSGIVFLSVMTDASEETKEICRVAKVEKTPLFQFYKNGEVVLEEKKISGEVLAGGVLYYGETDAPIHQLETAQDLGTLIENHEGDPRLLVVDVSLKNCGPCAKVYPTVVNLSKSMSEVAVFARIFGDENESCEKMMRDLNVREVPTFLFIRDGEVCGRYVGSGKGELIGEVLRYQGVQCT